MDALSQLSYSPVRITLFLKGNCAPLAWPEGRSRRTEGREDTRNLPLEKRRYRSLLEFEELDCFVLRDDAALERDSSRGERLH